MSRILWLAFEKPPHPDAVCHPATTEDVLFALELLESSDEHRQRLSGQLRRYLAQQSGLAPWSRPAVPCRRASGLYALVPWRFAQWLASVLPASQGLIDRTRTRLQSWLENNTPVRIVHPQESQAVCE
ncbi:MAG: hypothetical protein B7Z55_00990 [Planctomycetales bacterium 12-60-4]|nr:MAG: hypothetical protein B7Z55_00990 [Planctomycetales bacterium 12-60-4]